MSKVTEIRQNGRTFRFVEEGLYVHLYAATATGDARLCTFGRDEFFAKADASETQWDLHDGTKRVTVYGNTLDSAADRIRVRDAKVGDFLAETLYTDTRVWEVVGTTPTGLKIRHTRQGEKVKSENRDGNPYPVVWTEALPLPEAETRLVRRRKDGTYRTGQGMNPLRPASFIDGKPVTYTDYRE